VKLLRTFIAIELPPDTQAYLFQTGKKMAAHISDRAVRWVAPENIHLTLRFLGDTTEDKLPLISAELDKICQDFQPFLLYLSELVGFPNQKRPRDIWADLSGDLKKLMALQSQIESFVQSFGWQGENRPFQAHLTIGRVKDQNQAKQLIWDEPIEKKAVPVSAVNLIESRLYPTGPVYTVRHRSILVNSGQ
jgi:2'-5' RNA ligase